MSTIVQMTRGNCAFKFRPKWSLVEMSRCTYAVNSASTSVITIVLMLDTLILLFCS